MWRQVIKASEVADEQMVNCKEGKISTMTQFMDLTWQSGLFVRSQESVVDNTILRSINSEPKPVI